MEKASRIFITTKTGITMLFLSVAYFCDITVSARALVVLDVDG